MFTRLRLIFISVCFTCCTITQESQARQSLTQRIDADEYKQITSILVSHKGARIFEEYYNDGSPEKLNDIRSASKTFTALAVGLAIEQGLFPSVHNAILDFLPNYQQHLNPFKEKQNLSFLDLLTMTSSLECNDWNSFSLGNEERMYLQADWTRFILDLPKRGIPPWETPVSERFNHKAFSYCTGGVFLLGKAIEDTSGLRADRYLQQRLFNKMDIDNLVWPKSPNGHAQTGGGVRITSPDLLKVGELILNKGKWKIRKNSQPKEHINEQLISAQWIKQMQQPYVEIDAERNIKYGYLLWIYEFPLNKSDESQEDKHVTAWAASGNGGNYLWIVPELDMTAVITSTAYNQSYMHRQSQEIFEQYIIPMVAQN